MGAGLAWPIPSAQRECGLGGEHGDEEEAHTAQRSSLSVKNGDMEAPQDSMQRFLFSYTGVAAGLDLLHPPVPTMQHLSHPQDEQAGKLFCFLFLFCFVVGVVVVFFLRSQFFFDGIRKLHERGAGTCRAGAV